MLIVSNFVVINRSLTFESIIVILVDLTFNAYTIKVFHQIYVLDDIIFVM
jgi:hypothetical protein